MSESTDAVIVVVSEETGAISIAHNEQLLRKLTPESLRDELHKLFVSNEDGNSKTYNGMSLFQRLKNLLHLSGR